jgi:spore maturation protein CgeB
MFRDAHKKKPVDWVFCYGGGQDISASVIKQIKNEFGVPAINMTFDDKHGWAGPFCGEHCTGAKDITKEFDVFFTSARVACEWHLAEGGRALYMPEGFDSTNFYPEICAKDIPVSFVGASYGFRKSVIRFLHKHGVNIHAFGNGWPNGFANDPVEIFNRSVINLGMGGIGYSESLTNVKGRDFEIPGTGGGVYLTSFNPDLAQHFIIGEEILCYRNRDEMLELIRYYLAHPEEANAIAQRGRERCLREHRWLHRYKRMTEIIGLSHKGDS